MPTLTSSSDEDNSDSDSNTDLDISDKEYGSDSSDEDSDNCTQIVGNISDTTNLSTMNTTLSENGYHTDIETTDDTSKKGLDLDTCSMFCKLTDENPMFQCCAQNWILKMNQIEGTQLNGLCWIQPRMH